MKKNKPIFAALVIALIVAACNNETESARQKAIADSLRQVAILDSTHKADSIQNLKKIDTLQALGIYNMETPDSICDRPIEAIKSGVPVDPREFGAFLMELDNCNNTSWNKAHPDSSFVTVVTEDPTNNKVLFNTLPASTAEDIAKISKVILAGIVIEQTDGNPIAAAIGTAASNYTVDAYLQAAKDNDPLIIVLPGAVPTKALVKDGIKLTSEAYKSISKIDITKPFTIQIDGAKKVFVTAEAASKFVNDGVNAIINGVKVPILGRIQVQSPIPTDIPKKPSDIPTDPVTHWVLKKFHL